MKIDPNAPASEMTIRAAIAAKVMAAIVGTYTQTMRGVENAQMESEADLQSPYRDMMFDRNDTTGEYEGANEIASDSIILADALIDALNDPQGEKEG